MQHDFKFGLMSFKAITSVYWRIFHQRDAAKTRDRAESMILCARKYSLRLEATVRQIVFVQAHERRAVHLRKLLRLTLLLLLLLHSAVVVVGIIMHRRPCCCCVVVPVPLPPPCYQAPICLRHRRRLPVLNLNRCAATESIIFVVVVHVVIVSDGIPGLISFFS